jgi:tRNA (guanine-N7-)-methyltransferase
MSSGSVAISNSPAGLYELPSILSPIHPRDLFLRQKPIELELGSGDGSFLVEYARNRPDRNFIGIERLLGRIQKMTRKAARAGLDNLRAIRIESGYFLKYLMPPNSVAALHIYFPDPWPKRKHRDNRLVNDGFPALARAVLEMEGIVYLRTDDADYFEQMIGVFAASPLFRPAETPEELVAISTDFEKDFNARGIKTLRAAYQAA